MLKWLAIPFSRGPRFVRTTTMTHPSWLAPHGMARDHLGKGKKDRTLKDELLRFVGAQYATG